MRLYEAYRPKTWNEVVGQEKAVALIRRLIDRGALGGRAFWISGQSGQGKTTIARLLADEVADEEFVHEIDAGDLTPGRLRELEAEMSMFAWGKGGRAYIVNEAHGLRRDTIRQLLVLLERLPDHVLVAFTTTRDGQENLFEDQIDAHPLLSRCICIGLTTRGLCQAFAERCKQIAEAEGLDGQPVERYERLLKDRRNNMRSALQAVEAGEMLA